MNKNKIFDQGYNGINIDNNIKNINIIHSSMINIGNNKNKFITKEKYNKIRNDQNIFYKQNQLSTG